MTSLRNAEITLSLVATLFNTQAATEVFPKFSFAGANGVARSTESLAGKVVVLNFWFTTCPPCIEEFLI